MHRLHVGPGDEPSALGEERLDGEEAGPGLERAVLGEESLVRVAVDADDGPVRLLAGEVPGPGPSRSLARHFHEEGVRSRREGEGFHGHLA
ncbi:MAG: hypothetical protein KJ062_23715, partial [Thermoanaerobaculia bacterium]|nr:hypothetical protein [Thermoanaerobaculia bacterium]